MSIEKQLKHEYVRASEALRCPPAVDAIIRKRWDQEVHAKPWYRARIPRRVIAVALSLLLVTGFAYSTQQILFSDHRDGFFWRITSDSSLKLNPEAIASVHEQLESVRQQLPVGSRAYVYLPDLKDLMSGDGILSVSNPLVDTQYANWKQTLQQAGMTEVEIPEQLVSGFAFSAGMEGAAFYKDSVTNLEVVASIKEEVKQLGDQLVWRTLQPGEGSNLLSYTTTYANALNEQIHITISPFPEEVVGIEMFTPDSSLYENVTVHNQKAHYLVNDQSIWSPTQLTKSVSWMVENHGRTVMYTVTTASSQVTKEQLIAAAESVNNL